MNNFLRTIIAGYGAKKLGGGCFGTILVFIIIYYALGTCNSHPVQTSPQHHSSIQKLPTPLPGRKLGSLVLRGDMNYIYYELQYT